MPEDTSQHYDIFVHVYISSPSGDRRIGYQRYKTNAFLQDIEAGAGPPQPKWVLLLADPVYREELSLVASQLQFTIAFGPEKVREQQKLWGRRNDSLTTHGLVRLLLLQLPSRAASSPARKRLPLLMLAVYQQLLA